MLLHLVVAALVLGMLPNVSTVLVGMAGWCLICGRELWQSDARHCWIRSTLAIQAPCTRPDLEKPNRSRADTLIDKSSIRTCH